MGRGCAVRLRWAALAVAIGRRRVVRRGGGGPILANPTAAPPSIAPPSPVASAVHDPVPVVLPRDDGPHDRLTEWWYYTGHLRAGRRPALRLRVRGLPRRARPLPDLVGVAPRDHRRDRRPVPVRPAARSSARRSTGRHAAPTARRPGSTCRSIRPRPGGADPTVPSSAGPATSGPPSAGPATSGAHRGSRCLGDGRQRRTRPAARADDGRRRPLMPGQREASASTWT